MITSSSPQEGRTMMDQASGTDVTGFAFFICSSTDRFLSDYAQWDPATGDMPTGLGDAYLKVLFDSYHASLNGGG